MFEKGDVGKDNEGPKALVCGICAVPKGKPGSSAKEGGFVGGSCDCDDCG